MSNFFVDLFGVVLVPGVNLAKKIIHKELAIMFKKKNFLGTVYHL